MVAEKPYVRVSSLRAEIFRCSMTDLGEGRGFRFSVQELPNFYIIMPDRGMLMGSVRKMLEVFLSDQMQTPICVFQVGDHPYEGVDLVFTAIRASLLKRKLEEPQ